MCCSRLYYAEQANRSIRKLQVFGFVLDTRLGRVATYLRMLGFDVVYQNRCDDEELAHTSAAEHRILLTRDLGLLKRGEVICGYFVRATEPRAQLLEVLRRFNLFHLAEPSSQFRFALASSLLAIRLRAGVAVADNPGNGVR